MHSGQNMKFPWKYEHIIQNQGIKISCGSFLLIADNESFNSEKLQSIGNHPDASYFSSTPGHLLGSQIASSFSYTVS